MERFPEQFLDLMAFIEGLEFRVVFFFCFLGLWLHGFASRFHQGSGVPLA